MSEPYEVLAGPVDLYVAAVGTAFPTLDETPGVSWTKIGTSGSRNYTEDGVTVMSEQEVNAFRALGSTLPRKVFRTSEDLRVTVTVADLTLEQVAQAFNNNSVTTEAAGAGTVGYKSMGLARGRSVAQRALLVRGLSPYGDDYAGQFELPVVSQVGNVEMVHVKGEPVAYQLEFQVLEDPDATSEDERAGRLVYQNAEAGT